MRSWIVLALLLAPLAAASPPRAEEQPDKAVLANDVVTVWFQGKKPLLKVFDSQDDARAYQVFVKELVEVRDVNGDGRITGNEEFASLRLARAQEWNVTVDRNDTGPESEATIELRLAALPRFLGSQAEMLQLPEAIRERLQPSAPPANVTLTFRVYSGTVSTGAGNATANTTENEVKWDLRVEGWPWTSDENRLALRFQLQAPHLANATDDDAPEGAANATEEGEQGVVVGENETAALGAVTWAETFTLVRAGAEESGEVRAETFGGEDAEGVRFLLVFDEPGGYEELRYDPTLAIVPAAAPEAGEEDEEDDTPGFGLAMLVAAAALVAFAVRRRRPA